MSDVKRCDRCGAVYKKSGESRVIHEFRPSGVGMLANGGDACPECSKEYAAWWNAKRKEDGE